MINCQGRLTITFGEVDKTVSNNEIKKRKEKYHLDKVRYLYDEFPLGDLTSSEEPDFLVTMPDCIVGIEMVDYVRGQSSYGSQTRKIEILNNQIVDKAREEFEKRHNIPLQVHCFWGFHGAMRRVKIKRLAVCIASCVENHIPQKVHESSRIEDEEIDSSIEEVIASISIVRLKPSTKSLWSNPDAGFIGLHVDELQQLISFKDSKIDKYLKKCANVWLLIVADGKYISSSVELKDDVRHHRFKSRFDRILFYDSLTQKVTLINKV